jgi:cytochrome c-type biogenesis protein CcsB
MKKIFSIFFSMALTGVFILIFAVAIAIATFIENDFGTEAAKLAVYNAKWLEVLLLLMSVNMIGSLFKYKVISKKKWAIAAFHISFVIIIIGAAVTRYFGHEGSMHIREGQTANTIESYSAFLSYDIEKDNQLYSNSEELLTSKYKDLKIDINENVYDKELSIISKDFVPEAAKMMKESENGKPNASIIMSDSLMQYQRNFIGEGGHLKFGNVDYKFSDDSNSDISFISENDTLKVRFNKIDGFSVDMKNHSHDTLQIGKFYAVNIGSLYQVGMSSFIIREFNPKSEIKVVSMMNHEGTFPLNAIGLSVKYGDETKNIYLFGSKNQSGNTEKLVFDDAVVYLNYGPKKYKLPFKLKLNDFVMERYTGSNSPSSYKSHVSLIDKEKNVNENHSIFMNNILNYRGYRFFQSSYDKDEKGTILSVNYDPMGTAITYFGYFLMTLGMFLALFSRKSYFRELLKKSNKTVIISLIALFGFAANVQAQDKPQVKEEIPENKINAEHAEEFGELLVVDLKGRVKPINTLSSEIIRKLTKKRTFKGFNPTEMFLSMTADPIRWQNAPFIKVSNDDLKDSLGIEGDYSSFNNIIQLDRFGGYKIKKYIDNAFAKKVNERTKFDKDVIKVDERINICFIIFSGSILTVFPNPDGIEWVTAMEANNIENHQYKAKIKQLHFNYLNSIRTGINESQWQDANRYLDSIKVYQQEFGGEKLPSQSKIKAEVFYNKASYFSIASKLYLAVGLVLLIVLLVKLFSKQSSFKYLITFLNLSVIALFIGHTFFLGLRWYIAGHAPWSNGYETTLFIAWVTILAGLLFMKKSEISLALTTVIGAILLLISSLSFMDPEITNLAPVLNSYWLIIHVAVITSSYGFFALSAIMGLTNLSLNIFRFKSNKILIDNTISELSAIISMAMIIGLYLMTIGTFLGAVWANESWGRYWGWDPKETWALITVLVYTFVTHMRNIPGLKSKLALSTGAIIGFATVLMTYFGVNYFLSGMHSYAGGDEVTIPNYVYYLSVSIIGIIIISLAKRKISKN